MREMFVAAGCWTACFLASATLLASDEKQPVFRFFAEKGKVVAIDTSRKHIHPLLEENIVVEKDKGIRADAFRADGGRLFYPANALPKEKGTVEAWVMPLENGCDYRDHFFIGGADQWVPGLPILWLWERYPRFDVDEGSRIVYGGLKDNVWQPGIWNHLVATWDNSGIVQLFVNGEILARRTVKPWTSGAFDKFAIGSGSVHGGKNNSFANAMIDSVNFYDRILSPDEIQKKYFDVRMSVLHVSPSGHEVLKDLSKPIVLSFQNHGAADFFGSIEVRRRRAAPLVFRDVNIPAEKSASVTVPPPFELEANANLILESHWRDGLKNRVDRVAKTAFYVPPPMDAPSATAPKWKLLRTVDPYSEQPVAAIGQTVPRKYGSFKYRESGICAHDRFAYTFHLPARDLLLRVRVRIPDNHNRAMLISQGRPDYAPLRTCGTEQQALGSGVLCGGEYPVSGKILEYEYIFRHPSDWLALNFEGYTPGQPAAIGKFSVEYAVENAHYGPAEKGPLFPAKKSRLSGLYWEDPVLSMNFGGIGGADYSEYDRQLRDAMDYFSWTGQNLMLYPTVWYNGPLYQSRAEKGTWPSGMRHHPAEFPRLFALRCGERGIRFLTTFELMRPPSLEHLISSPDEVIAGRDSINTVTKDGKVLTAVNMCFPPVVNALRPELQNAVERMVAENLEMCGDIPAFGGVAFSLSMGVALQLGLDLDISYDDWTMTKFSEFRKEKLPGTPKTATRFTERSKWILDNPERKEAFLKWRADRMTAFYKRIADRIRNTRPDLELYLVIASPNVFMSGKYPDVFLSRKRSERPMLEQGLDLPCLSKMPGIHLSRMLIQGFVRSEEKYRSRDRMPPPFLELDRDFQQDTIGYCTATVIHQQYFETHGELSNHKRPKLKMPSPWNGEAPGRCCSPLPSGRNVLGYYARALDLFDPLEISNGGFTLGTHGAEAIVREWTSAYRSLPAVRFADVRREGTVLLRSAESEGFRWYYLLNAGDAPAFVDITAIGTGIESVMGKSVISGRVGLRPYELLVYRMERSGKVQFQAGENQNLSIQRGVRK